MSRLLNIILLMVLSSFCTNAFGQKFTGFQWAKRASEYEAQRYLMKEVYDVPSDEIAELRIKQCGEYIDEFEGFIFVLTAYQWKNETGVVISSLVVKGDWSRKDIWEFQNVRLLEKEFNTLNRICAELAQAGSGKEGHQIQKFDSGLIAEYVDDLNGSEIRLWVNDNRHTFTIDGWNSLYKSFAHFKKKIAGK